jgi:hypothetical protein
VHQLLGGRRVRERGPPDLAALHERHAVALRGDRRRAALTDAPRISSGDRHDPDRLLDARDQAVRIRVLAFLVRAATAHEHDGAGVGRPA